MRIETINSGDEVFIGADVKILEGAREGNICKILSLQKPEGKRTNWLLRVKTPLGYRVYDPRILGLKII